MDATHYYVTTLTNAAKNLGPIVIAIVVGYVVFIKLPMMTVKSGKENKPQEAEPKKPEIKDTEEKLKIGDDNMAERLRMAREEKERNQKRREEERKHEKKEEKKQETPPKRPAEKADEAMELFEFKPGQQFTKSELKRKYHELLRENHPDKVATLGKDFKKLAEQKTKDINSAYDKLKKKAA